MPKEPLTSQTLEDLIYNAEITDQVIEVGRKREREDRETERDRYDQFGSVLVTKEEIPPETNRKFAANLYENFHLCQRFLAFTCRLPIVSLRDEETTVVSFESHWNKPRGILFLISASFFAIIGVLCSINMVSTMLDTPVQPLELTVNWIGKVDPKTTEIQWEPLIPGLDLPRHAAPTKLIVNTTKTDAQLRSEEMFVFRRNLATQIIILAALYHIVICDFKLFLRRNFITSYLTYWTESVEIMKIDAAGDVGKYCYGFLLYYCLWFLAFLGINIVNIAPASTGAPVSFVILWFRCFHPSAYALDDIYIFCFRVIGSIVFMFIVFSSKAYIFFFLFVCRILRTACIVWNERLEAVFTMNERRKSRSEKCVSRTGYDHLFKDYVNILDLMNGADSLFTNVLESYFTMSLISIVFEVYYLARPLSGDQHEFSGARVMDIGIVGAFLFNSVLVFYLVCAAAADVSVAASDGLEIIRRQGIMGHRSEEEMHFMISVYMSFTGHFDSSLVGGGYFVLNKTFIIGIIGALISYIIIIFQFQPALGLSDDEQKVRVGVSGAEPEDRIRLRTLVMHIENTWMYFDDLEPGS